MTIKKERIEELLLDIFLIVALLDPANIFIGLKSVFFAAFIICVIVNKEPAYRKYVGGMVLLYIISLLSSVLGRLQGVEVEEHDFIKYLTTFSTLIILLWYYKFDISTKLLFPSILLSILTMGLYVIMLYFPEIEAIVWDFSLQNDHIFQISHRSYLGVEFISCYYTPLIIVSIPCAFSIYKFLFEIQGRKKNFLLSVLFMTALFCGGNKACLGGMGIMIICMFFRFIWVKKNLKHMALFIYPLFLILFVIIAYNAWMEKDKSNDVKREHLESYIDLYSENPQLLITGMGGGAKFYTKGFGESVSLVEWQYLEIIRMFGLLGGTFVIFFCWYPMIHVYKHRNKFDLWYPFVIGYLDYMIMSVGNPYLMNSTGMIVVLTGYTYIYHHTKKK